MRDSNFLKNPNTPVPEELLKVHHYKAPNNHNPNGRVIKEGFEDIEFITAGETWYKWNDRLYSMTAGYVLCHQPGEMTTFRNNLENPYECLVLHFKRNKKITNPLPKFFLWSNTEEAIAFTRDILNMFHNTKVDKDLIRNYLYNRLCIEANKYLLNATTKALPSNIRKALEIIRSEYNHDLNLDDIAERSNISTPHLHNLFKKHMKTTPYKYMQKQRLDRASQLLSSTDLPIKEVAAKSGFNDIVNFTRVFKKAFDIPPGEYRKEHTNAYWRSQ